jgi:hypothetical protein
MDLGGLDVRVDKKSEKFWLIRYHSAQSRVPMIASHSSMRGDADQVAKIEGENRALIAAVGEPKP